MASKSTILLLGYSAEPNNRLKDALTRELEGRFHVVFALNEPEVRLAITSYRDCTVLIVATATMFHLDPCHRDSCEIFIRVKQDLGAHFLAGSGTSLDHLLVTRGIARHSINADPALAAGDIKAFLSAIGR